MNVNQLECALQALGVPADAYSIGRERDESYCLVRDDENWSVFFSERGKRSSEQTFASEEEACRELMNRLMHDHVVQRYLHDRQ